MKFVMVTLILACISTIAISLTFTGVSMGASEAVSVGMDELAQRVTPSLEDEERTLSSEQYARLRGIIEARKSSPEEGLLVIFISPSGASRTLAAEALATESDLPVYRVDLSRVVSKYIGETEKNLSRIFEAAESANAVLFFDEADALFGRRTEVKDAHDRYANMETRYLLERMESYSGISILTANSRKNLDEAFLRRFRYVIMSESERQQYHDEDGRTCCERRAISFGLRGIYSSNNSGELTSEAFIRLSHFRWLSSDLAYGIPVDSGNTTGEDLFDTNQLLYSLVFSPDSERRLTFYLGGGFGIYEGKNSESYDRGKYLFKAAHCFGGLRANLGKHISINGGVRYLAHKSNDAEPGGLIYQASLMFSF